MIASPPMVPWTAKRASVGAAVAAACAAVALWVSFGALSFVEADNGAAYVGVLPPLHWLALSMGAAVVGIALFRPTSHEVAPLWWSGVAILPWLPLPLPLSVLIWSGNLLLWLWAAIALAILGPRSPMLWGRSGLSEKGAALVAAALAAALFGLGTWSVAPAHPDGDEPHYLVITQSLLLDRDIQIENNHTRADYQAYLDRSIKPDFLKRGTNGQIYSIHAPGLSVLVAPGFALLGYAGVLTQLVLISAAASALFWVTAWRATRDMAASWFGWAVFALTVPFFFHASAIFPDGPGAVLLLPAILPLVERRAREPRPLALIGAALAIMPWLSSRYVPLAAMAALVIAARIIHDRGDGERPAIRLAAFSLFPVVSAAAFFLFFILIYGTPNPSVVYGGAPSMSLSLDTLARGLPGLLFDQQFGLIPNAPVFLCAFAGLALMIARGPRRLAVELLLIAIPYVLIAASFTSWWGGTTAPGRYFAPVSPLLALAAAFWFAGAASAVARAVSAGTLFVSVLMTATIASVDRGAFVFNFRDGLSRVALWLSPAVDLTTALPSLFQNPAGMVLLQTTVWLLAVAAAVAAAAFVSGRTRMRALVAFGLAFQLTAMAAVSIVWRSNDATVATPFTGGPAVLRRVDPGTREIALSYRPFRRINTEELPKQLLLARTRPEAAFQSLSVNHLPAGLYEISGTTAGRAAGRVRLKTDRAGGPLAEWDAAEFGATWTRQVTMPVAVASLQVEADTSAQKSVNSVSIRAISVSRSEDGWRAREARRGARYGPAAVFLLDGDAWVEPGGIWVAGRSSAEFAVAPDANTPVRLFVRNGPVENIVTLGSGAWRETLTLRPGDERLLELPIDSGRRTIPLRVAASGIFRPSDHDEKSEDRRSLGVWLETR